MIKYQTENNKEKFINNCINDNSNFWPPYNNYFSILPSTSKLLFSNSTILSNTGKHANNNNNLRVVASDQVIVKTFDKNERPSRKRSKKFKSTTKNSSTTFFTSTSPSRPPKAKRKKSATKEKQRNLEIKAKLRKLNSLLPCVGSTELPRIRILRLANAYIEHLKKMFNGDQIFCEKLGCYRLLTRDDFAIDVNKEMKRRNSYSHLVDEYEEKTRKNSESCKESSISFKLISHS